MVKIGSVRPAQSWAFCVSGGGLTRHQQRKIVPRTCAVCEQPFMAAAYDVKRGKGKLCSLSCAASKAANSRLDQTGSANPNWRGGESLPYREAKRRYRSRHPHKVAAHMAVRSAVRQGKLAKSTCEVCGCSDAHAHHDDYSRPLDVIWLCKKHHEARHVELRRLGVGQYVPR